MSSPDGPERGREPSPAQRGGSSPRRREAGRREQAKRDNRRNHKGPLPMAAATFLCRPAPRGPASGGAALCAVNRNQERGPRTSPAALPRVVWGEEEQGSGRRNAHVWAFLLEWTLRRRGSVPGYGRFLQPQIIVGTSRGRCHGQRPLRMSKKSPRRKASQSSCGRSRRNQMKIRHFQGHVPWK